MTSKFRQISIQPIATDGWADSKITVFNPPDSNGFLTPVDPFTVGSLTGSLLTNAQVAVGYLIADAISLSYVVDDITIVEVPDVIENTLITPPPTTANFHTDFTTTVTAVTTVDGVDTPVVTNTTSSTDSVISWTAGTSIVTADPMIVTGSPVLSTDPDGNAVSTVTTTTTSTLTTPICPATYYAVTSERAQYTIAITRHLTNQEAGTKVITTEALPPTVRDAWLAVLANY